MAEDKRGWWRWSHVKSGAAVTLVLAVVVLALILLVRPDAPKDAPSDEQIVAIAADYFKGLEDFSRLLHEGNLAAPCLIQWPAEAKPAGMDRPREVSCKQATFKDIRVVEREYRPARRWRFGPFRRAEDPDSLSV